MTYNIKVRTWLLIVLGVVVVLSVSYTYWNLKGSKNIISSKTSPTPTISSVISPTTSAKTTSTSTPTATPTIETKAYEGSIPFETAGNLSCSIKVSFNYPVDFLVRRSGGTPMVGGATSFEIYQQETQATDAIYVSNDSADAHNDYSPVTCANPIYENLSDFASRNNISNYNNLTINNLLAIQYTQFDRKVTAIQNTDKNIVSVSMRTESTNSEAYNIIANSISFK